MGGLPRSGSTLLSSILNQNPKFDSGTSSPVLGLMNTIIDHLWNNELYHAYPKPQQASDITKNVLYQWHSDSSAQVIFDKNRAWTGRFDIIFGYLNIENPKIICPVRDVDEILTSFLTMIRRNPYREGQERINFIDEQLVKQNIAINDENRCIRLAESGGILYDSWFALMEGLDQGYSKYMHFVDYNDLITNPHDTLQKIYEFLEEESFNHDLSKIFNKHEEDDLNTYGLADMHKVRQVLKKTSPNPKDILPESILGRYKKMEFWKS